MPVTDLNVPSAPPASERSLSGWGRTTRSRSRVFQPETPQDVLAVLAGAPEGGGVIARGAGRSYGDAAQNGGGDVLDMTALNRVLAVDGEQMTVTAQAGATIAELMTRLATAHLGLPVVPGTRHVTLAGAIASDIHGKNHHRDGGFARHVRSLKLCTPAGEIVEVSPDTDAELFFGTFGGMGLTGVVTEATLAAEPLGAPWVAADIDRTDGLAETLALLGGEERHRYSVAWLDLLAGGSSMGRAIVSRADPLPEGATLGRRRSRGYPDALTKPPALVVPHGFPAALLRPASMRAFNELRWRASPRRERGRPLALAPYFFPLDALGEWNRLYGPAGLIQYQFAIPLGREAALEAAFELIAARRLPVYLAVFKRFGAAFGGPLSFPLEGWTLAIDMPAAAPGLGAALDDLDELIVACGGRVYLSKDARLGAELLDEMYPGLPRFEELRARIDPRGVMRSDLAQRLGLCESGA